MTTTPWMPLYVADYLADTRRLSTLEHGAYILLIFEYWRNGRLPDDDRRLARIVGLSEAAWAEIRDSLFEFFEDGWRHKRIEAELAKAESKSASARDSAEKRWAKRRGSADADATTPAMLPDSESQMSLASLGPGEHVSALPEPQQPKVKQARGKLRSAIAEDAQPDDGQREAAAEAGLSQSEFRSEWAAFRDHHRAKGSTMADWQAAWRTWLRNRERFRTRGGTSSPTGYESNFIKATRELLGELEDVTGPDQVTTIASTLADTGFRTGDYGAFEGDRSPPVLDLVPSGCGHFGPPA